QPPQQSQVQSGLNPYQPGAAQMPGMTQDAPPTGGPAPIQGGLPPPPNQSSTAVTGQQQVPGQWQVPGQQPYNGGQQPGQ
nr:hypothetical protein [Lautropia sp.]